MLSDKDLEDLLRTGESDRCERKRSASDLDRVREAVCAFANDLPDRRQPGVVFVGIEDNGECANIPINDELLSKLGQLRDDGSLTPFPTMEVRSAIILGCSVAVVIVQPSENPPVRTKGRAGSASDPDAQSPRRKKREGLLKSVDGETCPSMPNP